MSRSLRAFHYKIESRYILNECIYIRSEWCRRGKDSGRSGGAILAMNNLFVDARPRENIKSIMTECFIIIDVFNIDIDFVAHPCLHSSVSLMQYLWIEELESYWNVCGGGKRSIDSKFQNHFQFVWLNNINWIKWHASTENWFINDITALRDFNLALERNVIDFRFAVFA